MGMLARILSHARDDSFLMQCSRLPFWLNAKVAISVAVRRLVTRICRRYLSQASVDSNPLVVKYMREQNGILMGIITRYRSQGGKSVLDTQTVSIDSNKTQATFKLVPSEGTAEDGVASQNSSSPSPPSNPATDPDEVCTEPARGPELATQATTTPGPIGDDESTDSSGFWEPPPTAGLAAATTDGGGLGNGGDSDSTFVSSSDSSLSTHQPPFSYPAFDGDDDDDDDDDDDNDDEDDAGPDQEGPPDQGPPDQAPRSPVQASPDQASPDQASSVQGTTSGGPLLAMSMPQNRSSIGGDRGIFQSTNGLGSRN
jgi:hypothetical protein